VQDAECESTTECETAAECGPVPDSGVGAASTKASLSQMRLLGGLFRMFSHQRGAGGAGVTAARSAGVGPLPISGQDASGADLEALMRSAMAVRCAL
jgi:hypothetical protein